MSKEKTTDLPMHKAADSALAKERKSSSTQHEASEPNVKLNAQSKVVMEMMEEERESKW